MLWDADQPAEIEHLVARLREHADLTLPMVDIGCGNGRQARALADLAPRVLGIDASTEAIARARRETTSSTVEFRVADVAEPGCGDRLAADFGEANVHIRGVLHILEPAVRPAFLRNLAALLGRRGTAVICETYVEGDRLEYLVRQGATPLHLPDALRRCIASGIRAPSHFGPPELAAFFPASAWQVLGSGPTTMYGVPPHPGAEVQHIPSFYAVVRCRAPFDPLRISVT